MAFEDYNTPSLKVVLERTGEPFRQIAEYSIESSYLVSADAFSFTAVERESTRSRLFGNELEPVELTIDGAPQMFGRIEVTGPAGTLARSMQGRDYLSELVECHIDPSYKLGDGDTVERAILQACSPCGITTVLSGRDVLLANARSGRSIDRKGAGKDKRKEKLKPFKVNPGEGTYELINRIAARHHSTIQPALSRDTISLEAPDYSQAATYRLIRRYEGGRNNIVSASAKRDYSSFPTLFIANGYSGGAKKSRTRKPIVNDLSFLRWTPGSGKKRAKPNPGSGVSAYDMEALASAGYSDEIAEILSDATTSTRYKPGEVNPDPRILYRLHTYDDKQAKTAEQLESSAQRRLAELLKPTLMYTCTVQGHRDPHSGALWAVNTIAEVSDEIEQVEEPLWCASRTFRYSPGGGRTTDLEFWRPSTFQI